LAIEGDYPQLLQAARAEFSKHYASGALYYIALAQQRMGDNAEAVADLALYFSLNEESKVSLAARQLAVQVAGEAHQMGMVASQAAYLEAGNALDLEEAKLYYQALLSLNRRDEAARVFATYLRQTMDPLSYARMLVQGNAPLSMVKESCSNLPVQEVVQILLLASSKVDDRQQAQAYLSYAVSFENKEMATDVRKDLYTALYEFSRKSDARVQANKYQSLIQSLP
jgi:hypothetical protein